MPSFSSRSFCFGFLLAVCLSYVIVFYLIHSEDVLTTSQTELTKLKLLLKSKETLPSKVVNLNERPVAFDPVGPEFADQMHDVLRDIAVKKVEEAKARMEKWTNPDAIQSNNLRTAPEAVKPKRSESEKSSSAVGAGLRSVQESIKRPPTEAHPQGGNKWSHIHWHDYAQSNASSIPWVDYMSRNLVLGIAVNINPKNFAIFAGSFRQQSETGEAMIFINSPVSERHWQIAEEHKIRLIEFDPKSLHPKYVRSYHPSSQRWILFHRLLHANNDHVYKSFDKVIMVDVRDTAFQSDPFELITSTKDQFYVFAEAPGVTIESCGWNSGWIKSCFGEAALTQVSLNPILCSGISMGSMDRAGEYIAQMHNTLTGDTTLTKLFPLCERNGVDQGVHNYLVHAQQFKVTQVQYEHSFPVVNVQQYDTLPVYDTDPSLLLSATNVKYVIVHQYDRISALQMGLAKKYVKWLDMNNPKAEWEKEESCSNFVPVYDSDLFRGKCDYGSERSMSPASCCQVCKNKNALAVDMQATQPPGMVTVKGDYSKDMFCTGFTFANGVCYLKKCRRAEVEESSKNEAELGKQFGAVTAYVALPR